VKIQQSNRIHDPDLASKGMMICFIELPEGYDVSDIMQDSVTMNGTVCAEKAVVSDYDRDGIPDLTVKFDREQICALLEPGEAVEITVTGTVGNVRFNGTDTVRVIRKKNEKKVSNIPEIVYLEKLNVPESEWNESVPHHVAI